jgi:uncharacterized protein (TIGR02996 family)
VALPDRPVPDDLGFRRAIAAEPADTAQVLIYADWLDERDDARGAFLRLGVELLGANYSEDEYRRLQQLAERYRASVRPVDVAWLAELGRARPWVGRELAVKLARVYLRVVEGRRENRQWIALSKYDWLDCWTVRYAQKDPLGKTLSQRLGEENWLYVHKITGEITRDGG